jgi:crotonobetainyl-CoA hydratase
MPETIIYEKKNRIAVLTMNRPEAMNAINYVMRSEMAQALLDFKDDADTRVLIITGAGDRAFSAGRDLKEISGRLDAGKTAFETFYEEIPAVMGGTIDIWKPVIAAINGAAVGGGLELALGCDIRIAAEHAQLGLMEPRRGIIPGGGGLVRLPRLVPLGTAMEMLLTGDLISSLEACRTGLLNRVVPGPELMEASYKMAERIIACAPLAVQCIKENVFKTLDMPLHEALAIPFGTELLGTEDAREGIAAFAEKRKPEWKGK